jgi:hypothetical protein
LEDLIELPDTCFEVWKWFVKLDQGRSSSGFGANPISYADMHAFFQLIEITPYDWEIELIRKLDIEILNHYSSEAKKQIKK